MLKNLAPLFYIAAGVVAAAAAGYWIIESQQPDKPATEAVAPAKPEKETAEEKTEANPEADKTADAETAEEKDVAKLETDAGNDETATEPKKVEEAGAEETKTDEKPEVAAPGFDILRVERDGSTVIAGKAPAGSTVEIVDAANQNVVIGSATAMASGDYAIVLDTPLKEGKHELYIVSTLKDGEQIQSEDAGLVEIPAAGDDAEPVVIVSTPGQPTRVLQAPETEVAAVEEPKADTESVEDTSQSAEAPATEAKTEETETEVAVATEATEPSRTEEEKPVVEAEAEADAGTDTSTSETTEVTVASEATDNAEAPKAVEQPEEVAEKPEETEVAKLQTEEETRPAVEPAADIQPVLIQAADVEKDKIFIAGVGEPGSKINMYLADEFLGATEVAPNGSFLFEGSKSLEPGRYPVRADMLKAGSAEVLARAEVNLVHQPEVDLAKTAPKVAEETQVTEEKTVVAEADKPQEKPELPKIDEVTEPEVAATDKQPETSEEASDTTVASAETEVPASAETEQQTQVAEQPAVAEEEQQVAAVDQGTSTPTEETSAANGNAPVETEALDRAAEAALEALDDTAASRLTSEEIEERLKMAEKIPEIRTGAAVIIRRGDNLWRVARRNYGAGVRFTTIFEANKKQLRDPKLIYPGQILKVPEGAQNQSGDSAG